MTVRLLTDEMTDVLPDSGPAHDDASGLVLYDLESGLTEAAPMDRKDFTPHADQDFCGCGGSILVSRRQLTTVDKWYCKCSENPYNG